MSLLERIGGQLLRPIFAGRGVALMFHRVLPESGRSKYIGLRGLEVLPKVYDDLISYFVARRFKFISAEMLSDAILAGEIPRKFVVVTFDDGYRDNAEFVADYMLQKKLPWTMFLTTGFCNRTLPCWWYGLARILDLECTFDATLIGGEKYSLQSLSHSQRDQIYNQLRQVIYKNWSTASFRSDVANCFKFHGIDLFDVTDKLSMNWEEVSRLSAAGCEIGAHSDQHLNLLASERAVALNEIQLSKQMIEERLNSKVRSFAYPYGDKEACDVREFELAMEAGFDLAFTTRNGWLPNNLGDYVFQLPRINVSGSWDGLDKILFRLNGWSQIRERHFAGQIFWPKPLLRNEQN